MAIITNGTASNPATDALAAGHNYAALVLHSTDNALWFNIGVTAAVDTGELLPAGSSASINNLQGKSLSVFASVAAKYSVREAL